MRQREGESEKTKRGKKRESLERAEKEYNKSQQGFLELLDSSLVTAITEKAWVQYCAVFF